MLRGERAVRLGRIGLVVGAMGLMAGIVGQPLWQKFWPASVTMTENTLNQAR
jgi:hypothetical protein